MRRSPLAALVLAVTIAPAMACEDLNAILFSCTTDDHDQGSISLCRNGPDQLPATSGAQLRVDTEDGFSLVYPATPSTDPAAFSFSHSDGPDGYVVTLHFQQDNADYMLYSLAIPPALDGSDLGGGDAGVAIADPDGTWRTLAGCMERPYMFITYMQEAFACDTTTPFGTAGCAYDSAERLAPLPGGNAAPIPIAP